MAEKLVAPFAGNLVVSGDYVVRLTAVDPTTGATVSGVVVTNVNVDGEIQAGLSGLEIGKFMLVPGPET